MLIGAIGERLYTRGVLGVLGVFLQGVECGSVDCDERDGSAIYALIMKFL